MRIKVFMVVSAVAALAIGVGGSSAALHTVIEANVKTSGPGEYATATIKIINDDPVAVPDPIKQVILKSKTVKYNAKAIDICKLATTTNGAQMAPPCSSKSKIGSGTFKAKFQEVGKPPTNDSLTNAGGSVTLYNYTPPAGAKLGVLMEIHAVKPPTAAEAYQYVVAGIAGNGTITATVPTYADLPPQLKAVIPPERSVILTEFDVKIKPPKPKRGQAPYITTKKGQLDMGIEFIR